jgi:hypothetical protein
LYHHIFRQNMCFGEPKLSNFKIERSIMQNDENMRTKTAIKPKVN